MVEEVDAMVARVRAGLRELGIDRETYIMYFGDHGDMLGSHGQWEKSSPWEESVRIPMIIGTVGGQESIQVGSAEWPLNHVDIAPTTLGLCGISTPPERVGYDFSPYVVHPDYREPYHDQQGETAPPQAALLQQIPRKFHRHSVNRAWRAVVSADNWKYVCTPGNDWLLFDLNSDPYEMANLCYDIAYQEKKEALHRELARILEQTGDDFPLPDITEEQV
jgi:arylsulfatase A-like enzyme